MSLTRWFRGTSVNRTYTVSDITDATKMTGPLPVAVYSGGTAGDIAKVEDTPHTTGDSGMSVLGVRNEAIATLSDTQLDYTPLGVNRYGAALFAPIASSTMTDATASLAVTSLSAQVTSILLTQHPALFNGTTYDRQRNNVDHGTVGITAAGATTTQTGADQTNYNHRGAIIVLDMTSIGTGNVTLSVQAKDALSGKYFTIFTGAAVSTNSTNVYTIYPGVTAAANAAVSFPLPRTWRVTVTANNANATTYTVGASLIL